MFLSGCIRDAYAVNEPGITDNQEKDMNIIQSRENTDKKSKFTEEERSFEETEYQEVPISKEELERFKDWHQQYGLPLKGVDEELLQLRGNLELNMDETCYPELREALRQYREMSAEYMDDSSYHTYVHRADKRVLSFLERRDAEVGYQGYNYDTVTGQKIELVEAVTDISILSNLIENQLRRHYPDTEFGNNLAIKIEQALRDSELSAWTVSYQGMYFFFSPKAFGIETEHVIQVMVAYYNMPELFPSSYMQIPLSYAIELDCSNPFYYDLDLNGEYEEILEDNQGKQVYLLHTSENKNYIGFYSEGDLDCSGELCIYLAEANKISYIGIENIYLCDYRITNPNAILIKSLMDPIYMSGLKAYCSITGNGLIEQEDIVYYYDDIQIYEVLKNLNVSMVDIHTEKILENNIVLQSGTHMKSLRTDRSTWCDFVLEDGSVCRLFFDEPAEAMSAQYEGADVLGDYLLLKRY